MAWDTSSILIDWWGTTTRMPSCFPQNAIDFHSFRLYNKTYGTGTTSQIAVDSIWFLACGLRQILYLSVRLTSNRICNIIKSAFQFYAQLILWHCPCNGLLWYCYTLHSRIWADLVNQRQILDGVRVGTLRTGVPKNRERKKTGFPKVIYQFFYFKKIAKIKIGWNSATLKIYRKNFGKGFKIFLGIRQVE